MQVPELYGLKNCDSCRAARGWLATHGVQTTFIDLKEHPPDMRLIKDWVKAVGWESLLNRRSKTWRSLSAAEREVADARSASVLMQAHPLLVKRPVLVVGKQVHVGFSAARYADIFGPPGP